MTTSGPSGRRCWRRPATVGGHQVANAAAAHAILSPNSNLILEQQQRHELGRATIRDHLHEEHNEQQQQQQEENLQYLLPARDQQSERRTSAPADTTKCTLRPPRPTQWRRPQSAPRLLLIGALLAGGLLPIGCHCHLMQIHIVQRNSSNTRAHDRDHRPSAAGNGTTAPAPAPRVLFRRAATGEFQRPVELDALQYLQRYGYMNESSAAAATAHATSNNLIDEGSFHEAVMQFQRFAGLAETGQLDQQTVRLMQAPRCGNKDRAGKGPESGGRRRRRRRRRKRYALQGSKWRRQELTYRISQYPTRFLHKKHEVDNQIERAFKLWSQVAPIDFVVKKEGRVHIDIRFASGEHGDGDPFDGPGNTLAHAYFPQYGGDAHFDDQEYWTVDSYAGTNIFQVAAHELGHSLGLGHSSVREALMAPFYQKYKPNFKLHPDDILGIQALYGDKPAATGDGDDGSPTDQEGSTSTSTTTTSTTSTTEASVPRRKPPVGDDSSSSGSDDDGFWSSPRPADLCRDPKIDAITRTEDGNTYVFKGHHYWLVTNEGLASGYPARISRDWPGLPGNLDAALTWSDGKTFFFKGDKYWRFFNRRREPGYPKLISAGFAGIPNHLDAAFVWGGNGKTYFFKRDKYWRFDSKQEPPVSSQYPKLVKNWAGLPAQGLDAAFKWDNGMTYFFKDDLYYRFDDREFEVDAQARPAFPRPTADWWFGCTSANLPLVGQPQQGPATGRRAGAGSGLGPTSSAASSSSSAAGELQEARDSSSVLLFHRRPTLSFDTSSSSSFSSSSDSPPTRPAGSSISRSILSGLSALFPSASDDDDDAQSPSADRPAANGGPPPTRRPGGDEWSFHRGVGEEVRRMLKSARRLAGAGQSPDGAHTSTRRLYGTGAGASGSNSSDSRWLLPGSLAASAAATTTTGRGVGVGAGLGGREQSLSELRLAPAGDK